MRVRADAKVAYAAARPDYEQMEILAGTWSNMDTDIDARQASQQSSKATCLLHTAAACADILNRKTVARTTSGMFVSLRTLFTIKAPTWHGRVQPSLMRLHHAVQTLRL